MTQNGLEAPVRNAKSQGKQAVTEQSSKFAPPNDSVRKTLSIDEAAKILGISRGAAYAHANDGSIPTIRLGRRLLVPRAALEKLLAVN